MVMRLLSRKRDTLAGPVVAGDKTFAARVMGQVAVLAGTHEIDPPFVLGFLLGGRGAKDFCWHNAPEQLP
jgi:hypothetical protein